mgnify:FL=1
MSYCVNCGVELDSTAEACPLCHTPVYHPRQPIDRESPKPFPTERQEVPLAAKWELAVLISAMLASAAVCCGILNIFLRAGLWSLYIIGAAAMLWIFLVPPLLRRGLSPVIQLLADVAAVSAYVGAIAWNLHGLGGWYLHIALPVILWLGAELLTVMLPLRRGRSILSTITIIIGAIGVFPVGVELFCDLYFRGVWQPGWSLVVLTIGVALMIPLIVVRRVPSLREEVRRRFHM